MFADYLAIQNSYFIYILVYKRYYGQILRKKLKGTKKWKVDAYIKSRDKSSIDQDIGPYFETYIIPKQ